MVTSEQFIFSGSKRWRPRASDNSQVPKGFHSLLALQNGGYVFSKGSSSDRQFSNKIRSKRCLFWYSSRQNMKKRVDTSSVRNKPFRTSEFAATLIIKSKKVGLNM